MAYAFYLGIDAHATENGTTSYAIALLEKSDSDGTSTYRVHELRRLEGSAGKVAEDVQNSISRDPFVGRTVCVANATDKEGRELHKALVDRGLSPIGVQISGGDAASQTGAPSGISRDELGGDGPGLEVSEHVVVENVEELYHAGRMELDPVKTDEASDLTSGLDNYRQRAQEPGMEGLEHIRAEPSRNVEHADLVLATGVACWLAEQHRFDPTEHLGGAAPPTGEAKRSLRPDTT